MSEPAGMLRGNAVYRIHWMPGTDTLLGVCHCGAENVAEEPVQLWEWLLGHPQDHYPLPAGRPPTAPVRQAAPA